MLSVKGIYKNGKVIPLEEIPDVTEAKVIITFLETKAKTIVLEEANENILEQLYGCLGKEKAKDYDFQLELERFGGPFDASR